MCAIHSEMDALQPIFNIISAIRCSKWTHGATDGPGKDNIPNFFIYFVIFTHSTGTHSKAVHLYDFYIGSGLFPGIRPPWASQLEVPDSQRPPALAPLACFIIYPLLKIQGWGRESDTSPHTFIAEPLNLKTGCACPLSGIHLCLLKSNCSALIPSA